VSAYLIAIFSEYLYLLVIEIAHGNALDFVAHLSVNAWASRAHEHTEIHYCIGCALIN